jgi:hypothetical protein
MDSIILLGILGSVASISSLLISAPTKKSKIIHAIYGFLLVVVVGSAFIFNQTQINELEKSELKAKLLQEKLDELDSIKHGAQAILESKRGYFSSSDVGENRGYILTAFIFIEKNNSYFPESYGIAKKLIIDGIKISESAGFSGEENLDESKRMYDGALAMEQLLRGIAAGKT